MDAALDIELINDFFGEYDDACLSIREILTELNQQPDDQEAPHALFRRMHSVKSNLRMMGLNELSEFIHHLENILDQIRTNQRDYILLMSDLFLLSLETCRSLAYAQLYEQANALERLPELNRTIETVHEKGNSESVLLDAIRVFDPGFEYETDEDSGDIASTGFDDMELFMNLSLLMEQRITGKRDSTVRIMEMATGMNDIAGKPVDSNQLKAAVYMHDVGMTFLPGSALNNHGDFITAEVEMMSAHSLLAAQLLQGLGDWDEAIKIVLQHHERVDGDGYPNKLKSDDITAGAKLLNIVDTYDLMTYSVDGSEDKRTIIRVVADINGRKGTQFDAYWVDIFNQYIRQRFSK